MHCFSFIPHKQFIGLQHSLIFNWDFTIGPFLEVSHWELRCSLDSPFREEATASKVICISSCTDVSHIHKFYLVSSLWTLIFAGDYFFLNIHIKYSLKLHQFVLPRIYPQTVSSLAYHLCRYVVLVFFFLLIYPQTVFRHTHVTTPFSYQPLEPKTNIDSCFQK